MLPVAQHYIRIILFHCYCWSSTSFKMIYIVKEVLIIFFKVSTADCGIFFLRKKYKFNDDVVNYLN